MIDHSFYQRLGHNGVGAAAKAHPDDLLHALETCRSDIPYIDQLETTNNCNLRCAMCPRTLHMTREIIRSMHMDLFQRVADQIEEFEQEKRRRGLSMDDFLAAKPPHMDWDGAEHDIFDLRLHHFGAPLLDPDIIQRLQYVQEKTSFGAQFSETIINLNVVKVRELFRAGLRRLIVAVDATDADGFLQIRGLRINFDAEIQRLRKILDAKNEEGAATRIDVQMIELSQTDAKHFEDLWGNVGDVHILKKSFFPYPDIDPSLTGGQGSEFHGTCDFPYTSMTIMADGRVVPCCADYNGEVVLGDANTQTLHEIWNGAPFRAFREKFVQALFSPNELCNRCGHYPFKK